MTRLAHYASLIVATAIGGCGDDEHKGTISTGSAAPTASVLVAPKTKLLAYAPGSPIASMRVAERFKRRLARAGLEGVTVRIGGEAVHVEAPPDRVEAVEKALEGGRLDVHVWASSTNPFAEVTEDEVAPLRIGSETVKSAEGPVTRRFLMGSPDERSRLEKLATDKALGSEALVGPVSTKDGAVETIRSYHADAERSLRGEMVKQARIEEKGEATSLVLTFEGRGKNFLRWQGKQKSRLLLRVNGDVIGDVQLREPVTDGVLRIALEGGASRWKDLADSVDGLAVSHQTVLKDGD